MPKTKTKTKPKAEVAPQPAPAQPVLPPLPEKVSVLVTVFTYSGLCHADVLHHVAGLYHQTKDHPRLLNLSVCHSSGYPTTRCRNAALKHAADSGHHFVYFLDDDVRPDLQLGVDPAATPFLPTALDFALAQPGPVMVGAPYCAGPPGQEVVVMKNREYHPGLLGGNGVKLDKYTRDEAAVMTGVTEVAALPTGGLLVDTRVTHLLAPPWFSYEYADEPYQTQLASTEDVVFTRNAQWLGVKQFCAWNCWFGHHKSLLVGKPTLAPVNVVPKAIWSAFQKGFVPKLD